MSTSLSQPTPASSWKQEVSLRIAAHKSRRGLFTAQPAAPAPSRHSSGSRAAQAAARVAARYAQVPSFSQMQAAQAHAAQRAAGIDPQAALKAQTAGPRLWEPEAPPPLTSARPSARDWEPTLPPARPVTPSSLDTWESEYSHIRCAPDLALRPLEPAAARAPRPAENFAPLAEDGWERPALAPPLAKEPWGVHLLEPVVPVLPIHANLIEFPRELVATRKMRPRRVEGDFAAEGLERQLSIFEVDPGLISTQPEAAGAASASAWPEPEWSGIELEAQPQDEPGPQDAPAPLPVVELAPIGHRLMAALVDGALIAGAFLGSALVAAANISHPPAARIVELCAVSALLLAGLLYYALFLTLAETTPGMRCAGISLCTFDGQIPTRAQLRSRLGALLLSLVPVGLGMAWVLFDDDHLSWHDRLSRTYLRKC